MRGQTKYPKYKDELWVRGAVRKFMSYPTAFIREEQFYEVQKINEDELKKSSSKGNSVLMSNYREAFNGKLFCADCGALMTAKIAGTVKNKTRLFILFMIASIIEIPIINDVAAITLRRNAPCRTYVRRRIHFAAI